MKKRWLLLLLLILALVALAVTARWWLAPLLAFLGANSDLIQTATDSLQILLWVGAALVALTGWLTGRQKQPTAGGLSIDNVEGDIENSVLAGRDATVIHETHLHAPPDPTDPAALLQAYLHSVFRSVGHVSLAGIDRKAVSGESEAQLNLAAVYTALLTLTPEQHEQYLHGRLPEPRRERRLSALALLNRHRRLVLLGEPGSGKSTFVNFVAMCLAGEKLGDPEVNLNLLTAPLPDDDGDDEEERQPWEHGFLLPVRVILRDFAARGLPPAGQPATATHLWNFIAAELQQAGLSDCVDLVRRTLRQEGGLLLLDGLDEVPEANRRRVQIKQAVEGFVRSFPRCRVLVTSRTYAYQQQDWRLPDFAEAVLAPFSRGQILRFIDRWYGHIAVLRRLNRDDAQGRAVLLRRAIFGSNRLMALAERPLLLTLMASLHAWRGGSLPEKREELYADTVDLLLDWWESPKTVRNARGEVEVQQPSLLEWLKVDRARVRAELNALAYEAHQAQPELTGTADIAEKELVNRLLSITDNPDVRPKRLVEFLSFRAGLLLPKGEGVYTFPHRTIQEYLAACHLTEYDYPEEVAALARQEPNRWREVALLAGAKAGRGASLGVWALVDALACREPEESNETPPNLWGAHIAGQLLAESADLTRVSERNQPKLERVRSWLVRVLRSDALPATERAAAGDTLARLGDPRPEVMTVEGMQFCLVPAGPFVMGSEDGDDDEKPRHKVEIPYAYLIGRYPVTNAQYGAFVEAGGYGEARYWREAKEAGYWSREGFKGRYDDAPRRGPAGYGEPFNLPNHPVVGVSWYEAVAFCRWLEERLQVEGARLKVWTGDGEEILDLSGRKWCIRLPSEAEWEKAARGGLAIPVPVGAQRAVPVGATGRSPLSGNPNPARRYPWGDEPDPERANYNNTGIGDTSAVGCFPGGASPYGVEEMSGNVWEWCSTKEGEKYPFRVKEEWAEDYLSGDAPRVLRGGAFNDSPELVRCAYRIRHYPDDGDWYYGFRVVLSPLTPLDSERSDLWTL